MSEIYCVPPVISSRNEFGLICSPDVKYVFKPNGRVDWRAMIPKEFVVPNRMKTQETDISKLQDKDVLILLAGFRELAEIRGYQSITFTPVTTNLESVVVSCSIIWMPNYETDGIAKTSGGVGDATAENTTAFGKAFLSPIAENRAFIRAVRNFLKISVAGFEECNNSGGFNLQEQSVEQSVKNIKPQVMLENLMGEKGVTFDRLKKQLSDDNYSNVSSINSLDDLPEWKIIELTARLKKLTTG
jgi:hypothetical protein